MSSGTSTYTSVRLRLEANETLLLAPLATKSADATRRDPDSASGVRTEFQRDRDRILHSKSFRRLMHKTQVFIAPAGDHYRTRLTHTLEVTQVARTIGRALRLNEDLIEAIGLGHDLGHTPFGHAGETALAHFLPGFRHNEQSLRIVELLEKDGQGLNLTDIVRDGILRHSKPHHEITGEIAGKPNSLEAEVLKVSDGVAYINHDLDDAIRAGLLSTEDIPPIVNRVLGDTHAARINTLVCDIIEQSETEVAPGKIAMSATVQEAANALRDFLFRAVYMPLNERTDTIKAQRLIQELCAYFMNDIERLPAEYRSAERSDPPERQVADYVASMTDRFAVDFFQRVFIPRYWST